MPVSRQLKINIAVGTLLSALFGALLAYSIMAGGVGSEISLSEFLSAPENSIFTLLMCSFVFASWVMRGPNNRTILFIWALVIIVHQIIYWAIYYHFYYRQVNIYVLNWVGVIASIPAVLFLRRRVSYSCWLLEKLLRFKFLRAEINHYMKHFKVTDFEFYMLQIILAAFLLEYIYAIYLTIYALLFKIPVNGSIYEHLLHHRHWDPYDLYVFFKNLFTSIYIAIIGFYLFRDYRVPDSVNYGVSDQQKRAVALKMLERRRAKKRKNYKK